MMDSMLLNATYIHFPHTCKPGPFFWHRTQVFSQITSKGD